MVNEIILHAILDCLEKKGCLKVSRKECLTELRYYGFSKLKDGFSSVIEEKVEKIMRHQADVDTELDELRRFIKKKD